MGIALYHFVCGLEESGKKAEFVLADPDISHEDDMEYITSVAVN